MRREVRRCRHVSAEGNRVCEQSPRQGKPAPESVSFRLPLPVRMIAR
jgi:hypothetical protein